MTSADRSNLERFVTAQAPVFETVLAELRGGPEADPLDVVRLSSAERSRTILDGPVYGIGSIDEAHAYLAHPLLGPRLDLCARIVLASESPSLHAIFGSPDDMKFRSGMTLFSLAADDPDNPFRHASQDFASCRRATAMAFSMAVSASPTGSFSFCHPKKENRGDRRGI
jgi:uncharacterized protein (DUF1810 family)